MEFYEVIRKRRVRRHFVDTEIPREVVDRIVWAIGRAPSAGYTQGNRILVIHSKSAREKFWEYCSTENWPSSNPPSLRFASLLIIFFENEAAYRSRYSLEDKANVLQRTDGDFVAPYWTIDAAFMAMIAQLSAIEEDLDYLFFGIHQGIERLISEFDVPEGLKAIGAIAVGRSLAIESGSASRLEKIQLNKLTLGEKYY
ncbi:MAG: nitroreductase family protein [Actinomycetota bacterium]|nr:nitroreductase family protein [Actinomycetota bacterium]